VSEANGVTGGGLFRPCASDPHPALRATLPTEDGGGMKTADAVVLYVIPTIKTVEAPRNDSADITAHLRDLAARCARALHCKAI
jgi:hypothetical protein